MKIFKLLLILSLLIADTAFGQYACKDSSGNLDYPNCDSSGNLQTFVTSATARVCVAITPDTSAYAANDIVGGKLTFASAFRSNINSGILQSIEVTNTEIDGIAFNFCLFNADPTGSTVADQGGATIVAADLQKLIGCWGVSDGSAFAATELYQAKGVNQAVDAAATGVYGILRTTGAPTWAAAQTVNVCIDILQD